MNKEKDIERLKKDIEILMAEREEEMRCTETEVLGRDNDGTLILGKTRVIK